MKEVYGISKVSELPFEEALEKITLKLKEQGFGVLTRIDMQATLKEKLGQDTRRYIILGACNPNLAFEAIGIEVEIGLLLPCNVIIYENDDGKTVISSIDPLMMMQVTGNESLQPIGSEARQRLEAALEAV